MSNDGRAFLLMLILLALSGCSRSTQDENAIARVGTARLSMEEAKRSIDTTQGPLQQQLPNVISSWVTEQLLFQEAQREGVEHSDRFRDQLEQTRKQLAIQNLLQQYIYSDTGGVDEKALRAYFDQHAAEFFIPEDMVKLNVIGFTAREPASDFAAGLTQDAPWAGALARAKNAAPASIIALPDIQYFSRRTLYPPELWKVASSLNVNEVSFPIKTNLGYFVIQLLAVFPKGKAAQLDLVRDEVKSRLLIERRRQKYAEYLGTLRKRYDVEVLLNSVTLEDSTRTQHHE